MQHARVGELSEPLGESLVREGGQGLREFGEATVTAQEFVDEQRSPPTPQHRESDLDRAGGIGLAYRTLADVRELSQEDRLVVANRLVSHVRAS